MFASMNGEPCSCFLGSGVSNINGRMGTGSPGRSNPVQIPLERANELAPEERSKGLDDLHGVSTAAPECPDRIRSQLEELEMKMLHMREPKDAYDQARALDLSYVLGERIKFLRASLYDVSNAARRMAYHFECRKKYFGSDRLVGDLTFADLHPEDLFFYNKGIVNVLPDRDRSGRTIVIMFGKESIKAPIDTIIRVYYILASMISSDESVQKNGAVNVFFAYGQTKYRSSRIITLLQTLRGTPLRWAAGHFCYNSPLLHALVSITAFALASTELIRFKCHYGSVLECLYSLRAFGIPSNAIPINNDGTLDTRAPESHLDDSSAAPIGRSSSSPTIPEPQAMDVLMGRGKGGMKSLGNQCLKKLQEEYRDRYEAANRGQKFAIVQTIYDTMIEAGSRFMMQTDERLWAIVDIQVAKNSISHGFRNMRRVDKTRMFKDTV